MVQPQNGISSFHISIIILYALIKAIRLYDPSVATIIEKMCGIYKNQPLLRISDLLINNSYAISENDYNYWRGVMRYRYNDTSPLEKIMNGQPWVKGGADPRCNDRRRYIISLGKSTKIERHTDYIISQLDKRFNDGVNHDSVNMKNMMCAHVCKEWGLINIVSDGGGDKRPVSDNITWIQRLSGKWLWYSSGHRVPSTLEENNPNCTVIMWKNDPKQQEIIEILIPKILCDGSLFPREIFNESQCEETGSHYIKMHRGFVVGYMSKPYLGVAAEEAAIIATMPTFVATHGLDRTIEWHRKSILSEYDYEFTPSELSDELCKHRNVYYPEKYSKLLDRYYERHISNCVKTIN